MTRKIRVAHLASFIGNIGDNANHLGARSLLSKYLDLEIIEREIEIRSFYRREALFDDEFIRDINKFDLLIVGGGNYFELWPPNTRSGTSIDLGVEQLAKIIVPTLFYSLGVDSGQGVPPENKLKFDQFLQFVTSEKRFFVSVRNDGALDNLEKLYGRKYHHLIAVVPDGGFFVDEQIAVNPVFKSKERILIGLNLAGDMLERRLASKPLEVYLSEFANFINENCALSSERHFVLFGHIPKDMILLSNLLNRVKDKFAREKIFVAPYGQGVDMARLIFGIYKSCDLIIANRFHSNVVPIGFNVPTIGISNYPQIDLLYDEIGMADRVVKLNHENFPDRLTAMLEKSVSDRNAISTKYRVVNMTIQDQAEKSFERINAWLKSNNLK